MNEKIKIFIDDLKKQLLGLPQDEINEAVNYFEEYLTESLEARNNLEEVLIELGSPKKIAETLKRESNLTNAKNKPGIRNFTMVIKDAFKSVSTPLSIFSLSITALISYCIIALIFGGAVICGMSAVITVVLCIYQAFTIPFNYILEIIGTFGLGILTGGILSLLTLYLLKCGKLFIKLSIKQISLMLKLSGKPELKAAKEDRKRLWPVTRILLIFSAAGFILFGASGLPWRFITIFNSFKPEGNLKKFITEYNISDINKISALTAHSIIKVEEGSSDKIIVSYEEPDWLTHEISNTLGTLNFREKSNGKLPFFDLISLHDSQTELNITLPKGFKNDSILLQSTGGNILISNISGNVVAKTLTGEIQYNSGTLKNSITAHTGSGYIAVIDSATGKKVNGLKEYFNGVNTTSKISLTSTSGSVIIEK
ncbi:HAAS signaling domain-containing protein [Candidatus Clostridium radicumherbarum]|uniref:HAAS signaling domain-containing protein n=1 Tax=Candidatus Clostridium radicumherbarum TaxID=3381662 RepID=A0ABW8TP55_9CLOT